MLNRIKNSLMAGKKKVKAPYAKFDHEIAEALVKAGYLVSAEKKGRSLKKIIDMEVNTKGDAPVINEIRIVSKPSQRVYVGYRNIYRSKRGYGDYFVTTPNGVMTGKEARKQKVGGEVLFEIW